MDRPVRIGSAVILAVLVLGILLDQRENVGDYLADVGLVAGLFCAISLVVGYVVPKAFGVTTTRRSPRSMEIGVHNATLAIFVAVEVLDETEISVPAAVYSLVHVRLRRALGRVRHAPGRRAASRRAQSPEQRRRDLRARSPAAPGPRWEIAVLLPAAQLGGGQVLGVCSSATNSTS